MLLLVSINLEWIVPIIEPWESMTPAITSPNEGDDLSLSRLNERDVMSQINQNEGDVLSHIIIYEGDVLSQRFDIVVLYDTITTSIGLVKKRAMNLSVFWNMAVFAFHFVMNKKYHGQLFLNMMMKEVRLWFFYGTSCILWPTKIVVYVTTLIKVFICLMLSI